MKKYWEIFTVFFVYPQKYCGVISLSGPADYKKYLDFGFNILQKVDEVYVTGNPSLKKQVVCSMYAENLVFDENKYRTPVYHEALALILNTVKGFSENEKGQNQNKLTLSSSVVPAGIEPASKV